MSLPLVASVPFVNAHWRTEIFQVGSINSLEKTPPTFKEKTTLCLRNSNISLHKASEEFLLGLARNVDSLDNHILENARLAMEIGLGKEQPITGYPVGRGNRTWFFYPFMSALVLDQCLWALGYSGSIPTLQWIHPFATKSQHQEIGYSDVKVHLERFLISYGS